MGTMYGHYYRSFISARVLILPSHLRRQQRWIAGENAGEFRQLMSQLVNLAQNSNNNDNSVNQQILDALNTHNDSLKLLNKAIQTQNDTLKAQNRLLKSIGAQLGRMEWQGVGSSLGGLPPWHPSSSKETVAGTWKFLEAREAEEKRKKEGEYIETYGKIDESGLVVVSGKFDTKTFNTYYPSSSDQIQPNWSKEKFRCLLPQLAFNNETEIREKSGIYSLIIKYTNTSDKKRADPDAGYTDSGIVIGEVEFNSHGFAMAEGADWDWLLNNKRQIQLPYSHGARGNPTWLRRKISEPWEDGDELKFRIDTNENTIFYQRGNTPEKMFWNVLAFTNNRKYPDFLRVYAYCAKKRDEIEDVSLTIV